MNNAFNFILKALFALFINFYPDFFGCVGKRLDKKVNINFKINDVTKWNTNNYNKHIVRYLKK